MILINSILNNKTVTNYAPSSYKQYTFKASMLTFQIH